MVVVGDVAQLNEESIKYVVEDGDRSRGLVGGDFRVRPNSYDHELQLQNPGKGPPLRAWDFVRKRSDGTATRVHPQWSTTQVKIYPVEGSAEPVEPLQRD